MDDQKLSSESVSEAQAQPAVNRNIWIMVMTIVLTALVVGGLVFLLTMMMFRSSDTDSSIETDQQRMSEMEEDLLVARALITSLQERIVELESECSTEECPLADTDFPVVVYQRPGLLTTTERGRQDMEEIDQMLIEPMAAYYNENGPYLLTVDIEAPTAVGEAYLVRAIFSDGVNQGFVYSQRETRIDWWVPECGIGECEFSAAFRAAYPQIVERASP